MKTSMTGRDIIRNFEGLRLTQYPDAGGFSIGYGHLIKKGEKIPETITERVADNLFEKDIENAERVINTFVKVPLNQFQYDALVSFVFNVGGMAFRNSTMLKYINGERPDLAALEFARWITSQGRTIPALVSRREKEKNLFLS